MKPESKEEKDNTVLFWRPPYHRKPSNAIEMTGYGLLTYLAKDDLGGAALIVRWLSEQRNSFGGFSSTQVFTYFILNTICLWKL